MLWSDAEEVGVEELVAEFALWVVLVEQGFEFGHSGVEGLEFRWGHGEEFGPVGFCVEGCEFGFDEGKHFGDLWRLWLPGEVDGHGGALIGGADPEVVGGDGAELGDEEMRGDVVAEFFNGKDCLIGAIAGDEVFGLEFCSAAGGEVHAEVGHTLIPGAGDALLLGTIFGGVSGERMKFLCGEGCSVELGGHVYLAAGLNAALDPDLRGAMVLPVGKEADAVATVEDGVEVVFKLVEGEVFVDELSHLEGGDYVERHLGDDAEGSEGYDGSEEVVAIFGAGEVYDFAVGGDHLQARDCGGEVAVAAAGSVGRGGAGSDDGDVGQGREVVDGEALGIEPGSELAIRDACADGDGVGDGIDRHGVECFDGDLIEVAVGDGVEGVAGTEGLEFGAALDGLLDLFEAVGLEEMVCVVLKVAGPVGAMGGGLRRGCGLLG